MRLRTLAVLLAACALAAHLNPAGAVFALAVAVIATYLRPILNWADGMRWYGRTGR